MKLWEINGPFGAWTWAMAPVGCSTLQCTFYGISSAQCGFHSLLPLAFFPLSRSTTKPWQSKCIFNLSESSEIDTFTSMIVRCFNLNAVQSIDTENVGKTSNTNNIYNILKTYLNTLFECLLNRMELETHSDCDKWCVKKCEIFLSLSHVRPNAFLFGWYYFGWLSCCCCLFGWFFTSIKKYTWPHTSMPVLTHNAWMRWCAHVRVDNTLCVCCRKESEIVRSSTWNESFPLFQIASLLLLLLFVLFCEYGKTCCFSLHWFCPPLLLLSSSVVLMSLGSSIIEFMMSMCERPFFALLNLLRMRILYGVFVILLSTLKLDGFFWNRTVCGFM